MELLVSSCNNMSSAITMIVLAFTTYSTENKISLKSNILCWCKIKIYIKHKTVYIIIYSITLIPHR